MARYLKAQGARARRLGLALSEKQQRILSKRSNPPGQHGIKGSPRLSEYGKQLQEKQKAKFVYGILEKQMRNYYLKASKEAGDTGEALYRLLETRLDNAVFRAGLTKTRRQARQLVSHAHVTVNGKKVNIPSYTVRVGDKIEVKKVSQSMKPLADSKENFKNIQPSSWLNTDIDTLSFKVVDLPKAADMSGEFNPKSIVEIYSR